MKHKLRLIIIISLIFFTILLISTYYVTKSVNSFFDKNYLAFHKAIILHKPITIEKRQAIKERVILDYPEEIDTPLEEYICNKFGTFDCKTALAVFKAESGLREDAININSNGTIDAGIAQINSVHFKKPGCSPKELFDAYKNVDCAYTIWKGSGWNAWVVYNTNRYLSKYE